MESKTTRALRRHHLARLKKLRAARRASFMTGIDKQAFQRIAGILAHTAAPCSCAACGNPRRFGWGRTLRENSDIELMQLALSDLPLR